MVEELKKLPEVVQAKTLIIREGSMETRGFANLYEVLGFIDIQCNPQALKQQIVAGEQQKREQASKPQEVPVA